MMDESEECGDIGYTKISDGCFRCPSIIDENGNRKNIQLEKKHTEHGLFWVCPQCKGFYGKVVNDTKDTEQITNEPMIL